MQHYFAKRVILFKLCEYVYCELIKIVSLAKIRMFEYEDISIRALHHSSRLLYSTALAQRTF